MEMDKSKKVQGTLEEDINLIRDIAWSYVKTTGLDFDDLFQIGCITYLETENGYDSKKGKKSTYMYNVICRRLNSLLQVKNQENLHEIAIENIQDCAKSVDGLPEQYLLAQEHEKEILSVLSPEARALCNIILKERNLYLPVDTPKKCRGILYQELRKRKWSWSTIWSTFTELNQIFSETY